MKRILLCMALVAAILFSMIGCDNTTANIIEVDSVLISKYNLTLFVGQSFRLSAGVIPSDATDKEVTWRSSNDAIATCADGAVTATGEGVCTIYAATKNGATAICTLKVINEIEYLVLSQNSAILKIGETLALSCTTYPESDAGSAPISWQSTDESVAVCNGGVITAVGVGACTVKAVYVDGTVGVCAVAVVESDDDDAVLDLTPLSKFDIKDIPVILKEISPLTGEVQSMVKITGFEVERSLTEGSLIDMYIHVKGVKIFDKDGDAGIKAPRFSMTLYRENDEFCETVVMVGTPKDAEEGVTDVLVGQEFYATFTFYADISIGQREFYATLADVK